MEVLSATYLKYCQQRIWPSYCQQHTIALNRRTVTIVLPIFTVFLLASYYRTLPSHCHHHTFWLCRRAVSIILPRFTVVLSTSYHPALPSYCQHRTINSQISKWMSVSAFHTLASKILIYRVMKPFKNFTLATYSILLNITHFKNIVCTK